MAKTLSIPAARFYQSPPYARIQLDADSDALCFIVSNAEVFRLTSDGMEHKGQVVYDAGVAYQEVTAFFAAARKAMREMTRAELNQRFDQWWYHEGSGMPPLPEEDQEAHVHRVSQIAWRNGAYVVRQGRSTAEPAPTPCGEEA
jgi:hypothetical protein